MKSVIEHSRRELVYPDENSEIYSEFTGLNYDPVGAGQDKGNCQEKMKCSSTNKNVKARQRNSRWHEKTLPVIDKQRECRNFDLDVFSSDLCGWKNK